MFTHVCEIGKESIDPFLTTVKGGFKSLNPRKLGRGEDVTNISKLLFSYSLNSLMTDQKALIVMSVAL